MVEALESMPLRAEARVKSCELEPSKFSISAEADLVEPKKPISGGGGSESVMDMSNGGSEKNEDSHVAAIPYGNE